MKDCKNNFGVFYGPQCIWYADQSDCTDFTLCAATSPHSMDNTFYNNRDQQSVIRDCF